MAWVAPANLTQRNVGVLTMDNMAGNFDGIIFGELFPEKWMAGSDWFRRTERNQQDWPVETADARTFVRLRSPTRGIRSPFTGTANRIMKAPSPRRRPTPSDCLKSAKGKSHRAVYLGFTLIGYGLTSWLPIF